MPPSAPIPYADDVEVPPRDEFSDVLRIINAVRKLLRLSRERTGRFQSDVHVKTHGCAMGEFRVLPNLPHILAQGLFATERTYPALVRFSNSASQPQADLLPDGRGLALKVLDVEGDLLSPESKRPCQVFLMVNNPVFVARNVKEFLRLEELLIDAHGNPFLIATEGLTGGAWNPLRWHWRETLTVLQIAGQLPEHPASNTYFSMVPIRFGHYVAKYRLRPAGEVRGAYAEVIARLSTQPDALRRMLEETLRAQQILFEFQVQLRTSADTMPVEDATVEWPERESPFQTVALLLLPRQEIDTPGRKAACQNLSFDAWNALVDHRPLGGINRLRRAVYPISAQWRSRGREA